MLVEMSNTFKQTREPCLAAGDLLNFCINLGLSALNVEFNVLKDSRFPDLLVAFSNRCF